MLGCCVPASVCVRSVSKVTAYFFESLRSCPDSTRVFVVAVDFSTCSRVLFSFISQDHVRLTRRKHTGTHHQDEPAPDGHVLNALLMNAPWDTRATTHSDAVPCSFIERRQTGRKARQTAVLISSGRSPKTPSGRQRGVCFKTLIGHPKFPKLWRARLENRDLITL